ncbi:glycine betaine ABC transporter substrate-binding protein [Pseudonocardia endophytica]|uniref:glycine betaine ABC transporter substrate-binding protein n=1 Tax=Pseudonocardia endophytica TaxID=401976 RepID=UPI001FB342ED|nr:glycine betaine ABC transporter substrate-binding protein [Pseudonocardia endophytica]
MRSVRRLLLAVLLVAATVTGCASGPDTGGVTVRAAQFPWSAAKLTNTILSEVATTHPELGVTDWKTIQVSPATAWAGAQRGDVDVLSEIAMPNQRKLADKAKDRIDVLRPTYSGAEQGWFVPTYALAPGQPLAGLRNVNQLNRYAPALDGKLIDSDPSFLTTEQNAKRLSGYKLDLEQVTSSEAAQIAELQRAYERRAPILVFLYHPSYVFQQFDMTQLQEPAPYEDGCFDTGDGACAMPDYSAWTAISKDLRTTAPRFASMLERFQLPLPDVETMLRRVDVDNEDVETVARDYVATHPQLVQRWVGAA